jgi:hypothetical protein
VAFGFVNKNLTPDIGTWNVTYITRRMNNDSISEILDVKPFVKRKCKDDEFNLKSNYKVGFLKNLECSSAFNETLMGGYCSQTQNFTYVKIEFLLCNSERDNITCKEKLDFKNWVKGAKA